LGLRLLGLAFVDAVAMLLAYALIGNGLLPIAVILLIVTAILNWIFLDERLYPIRWLTPGLLLMILMVIYPLIFTIYIALTNYSDGHLLTKDQVIAQFTTRYFQDEDAPSYEWTAYRNAAGQFQLVFEDEDGNRFLGTADGRLEPYTTPGELPAEIDGYTKIETLGALRYLDPISKLEFSDGQRIVRSTGLGRGAEQSRARHHVAVHVIPAPHGDIEKTLPGSKKGGGALG